MLIKVSLNYHRIHLPLRDDYLSIQIMKVLKILSFFLAVSVSHFCYAQFPGGVSANLRGWYNGNLGVTLTGGVVSQWSDQSGNNLNATQATATSRPTQNTSGFNYNTMLTFDGQDNFLNVTDLIATGATGVSAFAVARQAGTGQDTWGCVILGQANGPAWTGGGYGLTALNAGNTSFGFWVRDYSANFVARATTLSVPALMSGVWNGTTANNVQYFQDGTSQGVDAYNPGSVGDNGNTYIGTGFGSGSQYCFYGDIAELIIYNTGLTAANASKVNSYLAIKYGITLSSAYVNTAGTTIFNTAAPYNTNIMGIGREDNNILVQKQARNYDDSTRLYISALAASNSANAGVFANNVSYVMTGANTGKLAGIKTEKPASIFSRLGREWMVTNTNFPSTFNMDIKLSTASALGSILPSDLRLLVDDDGDFSNATVYAAGGGLTFSYSNPVITVLGIGTAMIAAGTTSYITIASAAGTTPLPIELLNFKASVCNNQVCLDWQTATEKNNDHFEVVRSTDGINWEVIKEVKGGGNSLGTLSYSELDQDPASGISYYRVHQYDSDQKSTSSPIVTIEFENSFSSDLKIYPNPFDEYVIAELPTRGTYDLLITNGIGETMSDNITITKIKKGMYKINTSLLPAATYYLRIKNSAESNYGQNVVKILIKH